MKSSVILVGVSAALTAAQQFPDGFPDCGSTCIQNMLAQSQALGCNDMTPQCLCANNDFSYGVRDCAAEACPDTDSASAVIQYGVNYCAGAGILVSGFPATPSAPSGTSFPEASTTVIATDAPASAASSASAILSSLSETLSASASDIVSTITNTDGSVLTTTFIGGIIPIATTIVSEITDSAGSVQTTTLATSTIFSTPSGSVTETVTETASPSDSVSVSTIITESSFTSGDTSGVISFSTTVPVSSESGGPESSSSDAPPESTDSPAAAPHQTAAPALIAMVGLAAMML